MGAADIRTPSRRPALANFLRYLPEAVDRWVIAFEPEYHAELARALGEHITVESAIELGCTPPDRVRALALEKRADPRCGFIELVVVDGETTHRGLDYREALMHFGRWEVERVKLCFDVTEANFDALFGDDPAAVRAECERLRGTLADAPRLEYRSASGSALALTCDPAQWRVHSGLEPDDYMLPSGEIENLPLAADGELVVDGWLIGTIPFGMKYGRIRAGELVLTVRDGTIAGVAGEHRALRADVEEALTNVPGLRSVVELGIGQSRAVARAAAVHDVGCVWHERHYGLHLGLGSALVETPGEPKKSHHHLDIVLAQGQLVANGRHLLSW